MTTELNKWVSVNEAELPSVSPTKEALLAQILEAQEADINSDVEGVYADPSVVRAFATVGGELTEAVVAGDHGYTPDNIASGKNSGAAVSTGPAMMGLVRRMIPKLIGFDICGVQPMSKPTGQVFALHALYGKQTRGTDVMREAFHPIAGPDANWSGAMGTIAGSTMTPFESVPESGASTESQIYVYVFKTGTNKGQIVYLMSMSTDLVIESSDDTDAKKDARIVKLMSEGKGVELSGAMATSYAELCEGFNDSANNPWNEMAMQINKATIEAKSRQLKGQYSIELAQDLRAVHGMNADSTLSEILSTEIAQELDREVILWFNAMAQIGKSGWTWVPGSQAGIFDFQNPIDVRGARWAGEAFKAFIVQVEKESAEIARQTGRGEATDIICSRNVAAMMGHTDMFVSAAVMGTQTGMNADTTKATYAGILAGKYCVYIDQFAKEDYVTVIRKGAGEMDAALFYCPYVALTPFRGQDPRNFQPVMGLKSRYALAVNPIADSMRTTGRKVDEQIYNAMPSKELFAKNSYARRFLIKGL